MPGKTDRELLIDALVKIRTLKQNLEAEQAARHEPIAIVGAGCRFPGGVNSLESYWSLLHDGVDAVGPVPADRYRSSDSSDTPPPPGGFLDDVAGFDAAFFGISPREAIQLDPQQRLLLEVAWEALENAGLAPDQQMRTSTGVYVGVMSADYAMLQAQSLDRADIDPYMLTGNDLSFSGGRLSYFLGLDGPSTTVTTACSSSLVSVHLACQALRARECDQALAGGVNVILNPVTGVMLTQLGALAKDGRSKGFDASANGYGRGEGCGLVVLKRLSDALASGDRIIAVIRGSATNHDGTAAGLTVPNGRAQEKLIRKALEAAAVSPCDIDYVESHGTGTALGDPIEARALGQVFGKDRITPLLIGSVKSNFGHLESAAGIAGLLKAALALERGAVPAHLHFHTPSPHIAWKDLPLQVVKKLGEWPRVDRPSRAGVSSFGLSGVNAHVVLEQAPFRAAQQDDGLRHILTLSARTARAAEELRDRYCEYLETNPAAAWADICDTANAGRSHFPHRLAIVAKSVEEAAGKLRTAAIEAVKEAPKVGFLFLGEDLQSQLRQFKQWLAVGIEPEAVSGEGLGEFAAACAAGVFSIEDAERLSAPMLQYAAATVRGNSAYSQDHSVSLEESPIDNILYGAPRLRLISNLTGDLLTREVMSPEYWRRSWDQQLHSGNVGHAVLWSKFGISFVVRISDRDDRDQTLDSIAELYRQGAAIQWDALTGNRRRNPVSLPTYPFERKRFWALDAREPKLIETGPAEESLTRAIQTQASAILGLQDVPDASQSLLGLGFDSLMAAELCNWARTKRGVDAQPSDVQSATSIEALAELWNSSLADIDEVQSLVKDHEQGDSHSSPLSSGQKALWFIQQRDPTNVAYNVGIALRICPSLNVDALRATFQSLVARHPALRTTFGVREGEPIQTIQESQEVCFTTVEVTSTPLRECVEKSQRQPFDLENGPLLRVTLFTCQSDHPVLLIAMHHTVCDAMSYGTLLEELQTLYAGGTLPSPSVSYAGFVNWQREMLAGELGQNDWAYWERQLAGDLPVLNLPLDFPRPALQQFAGASHSITLPAKLTQILRDLSRRERVTLYTTLLAAFHTLLHRYSGQNDIIVGTATAGRPSQFMGVVGYFVNPVPIRADLSGNPSFLTLLDQVRRTTLDALDHQLFPFPLLVERLQPKRDPSRSPIFQVDFALRKFPPGLYNGRAGSRLSLEPFVMAEEEGQFDLSLHITEEPEELTAIFKYNTSLFAEASMERMARCFLTLLENIVVNPSQAIDEVPMLSTEEYRRLVELGTGPTIAYPETTLPWMFEQQARETPNAIAAEVTGATESLTYRELDARTNQLAHLLRNHGVGADTLVGICLPRGLNLVTAILAVLKAGGAYVPLDPSYPTARLEFLVQDSNIRVLITDNKGGSNSPELTLINLDIDKELIAGQSEDAVAHRIEPDDLAYVIYTSGSTGTPKGVLIPHRGLTNYLCWARDFYKAEEGCGAPVSTAIGFDATITSLFLPLITGKKIVLLPEQNTIESLTNTLLSNRNFSLLKLTPAHLEVLNQTMPADQCHGRANVFVIGGEALRGDTLSFWQKHAPATRLINEYGPTETVVGCCVYEASAATQGRVPIGRPIANTRLYVLDSRLQPVPFSVTGELYIGGAGVARGYLNRPGLTVSRFLPDPFSNEPNARMYRTGDLVRYLPIGDLDFLGRADTQVKLRGYRIETGEIEGLLRQHPSIVECAVELRLDQPDNPALAAYIVARDPQLPIEELRRYLRERLPEYMLPSNFVVLNSLPLTPNGKVDRKALPAPAAEGRDSQIVAPRDPLELKLAGLWEQVLNRRPIGVTDNFFDLGGHSLLAVRLMARMQQEFGDKIELATILRGPTIEQMARILRQNSSRISSAAVPIQPSGSKKPFFCVPGAGGNVIYLHSLAQQLGSEQPFYGLQGAGLDGNAAPHDNVEDMADYYMTAIRAIQPEGPYHLGGHSLGGWVAYEMAHRFERQGHAVASLHVIDTPAPLIGTDANRGAWDNARWIAELANRIAQLLNPRLSLSEESLRGLDPEEQLKRFQEALVEENLFPPDADTSHLRNVLALFKAHSKVRYQPTGLPLSVPITLFRTSVAPLHLPTIAGDEFWGWGKHGSVKVHHVPGEHLSVLRAPHVEVLAEKVAEALAKANEQENSWQPR